jgi:MFS family permease
MQSEPEKAKEEAAEMDISLTKANLWFVTLWLMMLFDYMDRSAVNAVLPMLKKEFLLTDAQLGTISSIVGLSIAVLALPTAILVDRWSRRKMISIMVALWSVATFLTGLANNYAHLIMARLGVGTGEAGYTPAGYALISAWYPKKMRGTMIGIMNTGILLGHTLGIVITGYLAYNYGWRVCFGILAIPGLLLALLAWFIPDYKTIKTEKHDEKQTVKTDIRSTLAYIFKTPALLFLYLGSASIVLSQTAFTTFGVTYFVRMFDLNIKQAATVVGGIGLLAFAGAPFGGWLGDRFLKKTEKGRLIAALVSGLLCLIATTIFLQNTLGNFGAKNYYIVFGFWTVATFFLVGISPNVAGMTQDVAPTFFRATAVAFVPLANQLMGGLPGPIICGAISDKASLPYALQIISLISVGLSTLFFILSYKYYDRALNRVRQAGKFKLSND